MKEILARFGTGTKQHREITERLVRIHRLAVETGKLDRLIVFGSYVTSKAAPCDVDVVLVMHDDFDLGECPDESLALFDHRRAESELGASCFWVRPIMLFGEPVDEFIAGWGSKREGGRRGIVEVDHDSQ